MGDRHAGIFCSPTEPRFNNHPLCMKRELLEECLNVLAKENAASMKTASPKQGHFNSGNYAEDIFKLCKKLNLLEEAKYLAVEIFERFMTEHLTVLYGYVLAKKNQKQTLLNLLENIAPQYPLRILSCCQIASKLTSHYKIISPGRVRKMLLENGAAYSVNLSSIMQSELRVLKTINFKMMITTPLVYLETMLSLLDKELDIDVKVYHLYTMDVLDIVYMKRRQIYEQLFELTTRYNTPSQEKRQMFAGVENDNIFLAVSAIAVVSNFIHGQRCDMVYKVVSKLSGVGVDNIHDLTNIITSFIIGN